ncbi:hypothetical protein [Streptomyces rubiginosohelvolus]|nr:hypothetical protein OG475_34470 [Streptomyces rubiginosohelvolus]
MLEHVTAGQLTTLKPRGHHQVDVAHDVRHHQIDRPRPPSICSTSTRSVP